MNSLAVVLEQPRQLRLRSLRLREPGPQDVVVDVRWTGISTGTERLLWSGEMPPFPGLGYPLVPGYEAVGRVVSSGPEADVAPGEWVFAGGASCFEEVRSLFGGAASRLVAPGSRVAPVDEGLGESGVLLALAATAYHAAWGLGGRAPELIVGHGTLGRLLARLTLAVGAPPPVVWEASEPRRAGADGYRVCAANEDERRDYASVYDASGDPAVLTELMGRLAPGGEIVLAGFYHQPLVVDPVQAFLREARFRVAAQWTPADLAAVAALVRGKRLSLDGLVSHRAPAAEAPSAYGVAFRDPSCVKMVLDWRQPA